MQLDAVRCGWMRLDAVGCGWMQLGGNRTHLDAPRCTHTGKSPAKSPMKIHVQSTENKNTISAIVSNAMSD